MKEGFTELKMDIKELKTEMKEGYTELKTEMKEGFDKMGTRLDRLSTRLNRQQWLTAVGFAAVLFFNRGR